MKKSLIKGIYFSVAIFITILICNYINIKYQEINFSHNIYGLKDSVKEKLIIDACFKYGIDVKFMICMIKAESNFNSLEISRAGAIGDGQLMPSTALMEARDMGNILWVKNIKRNPRKYLIMPSYNITLMAKHLRTLLDSEEVRDWIDLVAAYNAGLGRKRAVVGSYIYDIKEYYRITYNQIGLDEVFESMKNKNVIKKKIKKPKARV